jgi:hypothetical protein
VTMDDAAMDDFAVDGNAIAGLLASVFGAEMTTATGTCGSCGAITMVAELPVYLTEIGTVVRCRSCESVLMVFVSIREVVCVDLMGLASLS